MKMMKPTRKDPFPHKRTGHGLLSMDERYAPPMNYEEPVNSKFLEARNDKGSGNAVKPAGCCSWGGSGLSSAYRK